MYVTVIFVFLVLLIVGYLHKCSPPPSHTHGQTVTVSPHISHTDLRPTCHAGQQGEYSPQRKKIRKRKEKRRKSRIRMKIYCINQTNHPHRVSFVSWRREEKPE